MARRFVRVDLSDLARDFRPVAIEPGVPLLDHSQANARILFKWLGGQVAEPEWEGESVNFYVRDDRGGRLEDVVCQPATGADLQGPLKADLEALRERISRVKPETSTERGVHKAILREFARLVDDAHRTDRDNYFFRYKDVNGRWRLVWCWGYQRIDQQPATTLVCHNPECSLLFVRRPGQTAKCPSCEALQVLVPVKPGIRKGPLLVGLVLLLLVAALGTWFGTTLAKRPETAVAQAERDGTSTPDESIADKPTPEVEIMNAADRGNDPAPAAEGAAAVTGLAIEPAEATIHPGQRLAYQVTVLRDGARKAASPEDGVKLSAAAPEVGKVEGLYVEGGSVGTTEIVAKLGDQQVKATLNVVAGDDPPKVVTHTPGVRVPVLNRDGFWADGEFHETMSGPDRMATSDIPPAQTPDVPVREAGKPSDDRLIPVRAGEATPWFRSVQASISDRIVPDFTLNLEVVADSTEKPLEYRAYLPDQKPPDAWAAAKPQGDVQRAELQSPSIPTGPLSTWYDLVLEARNPADGSVRQCPLKFRIQGTTDVKSPANGDGPKPKPETSKKAPESSK
jgi:hypothetical protein